MASVKYYQNIIAKFEFRICVSGAMFLTQHVLYVDLSANELSVISTTLFPEFLYDLKCMSDINLYSTIAARRALLES